MNDEAALIPILHDREARWHRRVALSAAYGLPIGTLTLNIPGPDKNLPGTRQAVERLGQEWFALLQAANLPVIHTEPHDGADGPALHVVVRAEVASFKHCCVALEDRSPLGRLADADVLDSTGRPYGREQAGLAPRRCLLCTQPAVLCVRQGTHRTEDVARRVRELLENC